MAADNGGRSGLLKVLGFMHRLVSMTEGSVHLDILSDNICDALGSPGCGNWAAGFQRLFAGLGTACPSSVNRF